MEHPRRDSLEVVKELWDGGCPSLSSRVPRLSLRKAVRGSRQR